MSQKVITSLHSPHVEKVKALLGSRGKKLRKAERLFIADGMQSMRSGLQSRRSEAIFSPKIKRLYVTEDGLRKLESEFASEIAALDLLLVSEGVMKEMTETSSPQGVLALCSYVECSLTQLHELKKIAYFWQLQDPGNAGTVIRTADACGFDAVIFSDQSVDIYSPKVVRSTAGSLWNIPVIEEMPFEDLLAWISGNDGLDFQQSTFALDGHGRRSILDLPKLSNTLLIFGNEARGIPAMPASIEALHIPMQGSAESFNVASAAAITMFHVSH